MVEISGGFPQVDSGAVPVNDFLNPYSSVGSSRIDALHPGLQSGLQQALTDMPPSLRSTVKITSAYRSPEDQANILRRWLTERGMPVNSETLSRGFPGQAAGVVVDENGNVVGSKSRHAQGAAVDINASPDAMQWLYANSGRYGFENPSGLRRSDPVHFQLSDGSATSPNVINALAQGGTMPNGAQNALYGGQSGQNSLAYGQNVNQIPLISPLAPPPSLRQQLLGS